MALPICSLRWFTGSRLIISPGRPQCRARGVGASRSAVAARIATEPVAYERRSANYAPSMWDYDYLQSLKIESTEHDALTRSKMLGEVACLLSKEKELGDQLQLVDTLRQLGVAYCFEKEIKDVLSSIHRSMDEVIMATNDDLHLTSLLFRLLREHGFDISQDVFNNFKEEKGCFKAHLRNDIKGVLSLYEASFLAMEGETLLDEARNFATNCLKDHNATGLIGIEPAMKEKLVYALDIPLHWRMQRLHTRWFIAQYEREVDMNPSLLQFAKLDFNAVQSIYKMELKQLSRWWKDLGLGERLPFARDRLVENYLWTVGWAFDPKLCRTREATAKANCFITTIDDVYDVYGTLEELELFTDAVERWDAASISQLPGYMKICFMALYNTTNDTSYKTLKQKGIDVLPYLKRAWADICKTYLVEAKWYYEGYKPTLKEYLDNGCISISGHIALTIAYCMSEDLTKEALEHYRFYPNAVYHSSMILRLFDDLGTSKAELQRGDVPKSIQCYMHDNSVPEATARNSIMEMIALTWKRLNGDGIANSTLEKSFRHVALNIPRMAQCMYKSGDGHGKPDQEIKNHVTSLLLQPIPLQKN